MSRKNLPNPKSGCGVDQPRDVDQRAFAMLVSEAMHHDDGAWRDVDAWLADRADAVLADDRAGRQWIIEMKIGERNERFHLNRRYIYDHNVIQAFKAAVESEAGKADDRATPPAHAQSMVSRLFDLFPPGFLEDFGEEMAADFHEGCDDHKDELARWLTKQTVMTLLALGQVWAGQLIRRFARFGAADRKRERQG